uniref:Uncharacterized protein n=1 Tax=Romanomermis culicivorax TaxID=13658 RepID=A0A915HSN6_ROMCU
MEVYKRDMERKEKDRPDAARTNPCSILRHKSPSTTTASKNYIRVENLGFRSSHMLYLSYFSTCRDVNIHEHSNKRICDTCFPDLRAKSESNR